MDIKSKEMRSVNMSKIKGKNTNPERYIRSLLHKKGLRYRANYTAIEGKPDLYFSRRRVAVFIHGCYWHRHEGCKFAYTPKSNVIFWMNKFNGNKERDKKVVSNLMAEDIRVLIVWECTIKQMIKDLKYAENVGTQIEIFINNSSVPYFEL